MTIVTTERTFDRVIVDGEEIAILVLATLFVSIPEAVEFIRPSDKIGRYEKLKAVFAKRNFAPRRSTPLSKLRPCSPSPPPSVFLLRSSLTHISVAFP